MIDKVILVQPFCLGHKQLRDEILVWSVYIENYLKARMKHLKVELLYLPIEFGQGKISITSYEELEKFSEEMHDILSKLSFGPDQNTLIAISGTTSEHYLSSKLIGRFFQAHFSKSIVAFGGAHASARPFDFSYPDSPMDYVICGEGEIVLHSLISNNARKRNEPLVIKDGPIPSLDELPPLDLSIFEKYMDNFSHLSISLSRGCPYECNFCMEKGLATNKQWGWRAYNPERAIREVSNMINYGLEHGIHTFGFYDPIFGMNRKWLESFLDLYHFEDVIKAWIETRLDIMNPSLLDKLGKKNFFSMFGLESCSKEMLAIMNKARNPTSYLRKFEELYQYHLRNERFFMINVLFNHPGETRESYDITFNRLHEMVRKDDVEPSTLNLLFYNHFPGTQVYNNFERFHNIYGSVAYFPEWFKSEDLLQSGGYCVRPSSDLSFRDSLDMYTEKYKQILDLSRKDRITRRTKTTFAQVIELKKQTEILDFKRSSHIGFLNDKEIEV